MFFPDDLRWRPKWTRPRHLSDGQFPLFYHNFSWGFCGFSRLRFLRFRIPGKPRISEPNLWVFMGIYGNLQYGLYVPKLFKKCFGRPIENMCLKLDSAANSVGFNTQLPWESFTYFFGGDWAQVIKYFILSSGNTRYKSSDWRPNVF